MVLKGWKIGAVSLPNTLEAPCMVGAMAMPRARRPNIGTKVLLSIRCIPNILPAIPNEFVAWTIVSVLTFPVLRCSCTGGLQARFSRSCQAATGNGGCFYSMVMYNANLPPCKAWPVIIIHRPLSYGSRKIACAFCGLCRLHNIVKTVMIAGSLARLKIRSEVHYVFPCPFCCKTFSPGC